MTIFLGGTRMTYKITYFTENYANQSTIEVHAESKLDAYLKAMSQLGDDYRPSSLYGGIIDIVEVEK
jgi:phage-related baseplate assembly protein